MSNPKQIIVMRTDLNMRKGKMIAQGAHASMAVMLNAGRYDKAIDEGEVFAERFNLLLLDKDAHPCLNRQAWREWLHGAFTKICVAVNSEHELLEVVQRAKEAGIPVALITDSGLTEFSGVPTNTCAAIGPDYPEVLDPITGHLKLL
jgi:PTH2 family peptidyl-tRNA hydrolase